MRVNNYNCFQRNSHEQGRQKYQPTHYMNPPTYVVNNRQRPIRLQTHPFHNHAAPFNKSYAQAAVTERNVFPVSRGRTHTVPLKKRFQAFAENEGYKSTDNFERPCQITTRRANKTRPPNGYKRTLNTEQVAPKTHNKAQVWPGNIFPAAKISQQYFDTRMSLHQLETETLINKQNV
jgi:hypothetical protein